MVKSFIGSRLPVSFKEEEEQRTVIKAKDAGIFGYTKLRVVRPNIARAVIEDGMVVVYHCQDNARYIYKNIFSFFIFNSLLFTLFSFYGF